jgi:gliding motility-associated-like protein
LLNLPDTVVFCEGEMATILAANIPLTAYQWSTGATTAYITTPMPGLYRLHAQTPCYLLSDSTWVVQDFCESHIWIPNAFTPDGDGTNDFFQFFGVPEPVTLSIYNRWGERVFYSTNYQNDWDGSYKGEPLPGGAYTYLIEYKYINPNANQQDPKGSDRQIRGTVQVLR